MDREKCGCSLTGWGSQPEEPRLRLGEPRKIRNSKQIQMIKNKNPEFQTSSFRIFRD